MADFSLGDFNLDSPSYSLGDLGGQSIQQMAFPGGQGNMGFGGIGKLVGMGAGAGIGSLFGNPGVGAALGGAAGSMFGGGGSSSSSGYTLPPEYELQFLNQIKDNLSQTQAQYGAVNNLYNTYSQRLDTIYGAMQSTIPSDQALQSMRQNNVDLANQLGASAEDLVKNGFITKDDQQHLQDYQNAAQGKLEDPGLKQQHLEQRRQLQQDLARQGVPAAQQQIALQQFDQNARSEMFNRSVGLSQGIAGGLQLSQALRAQGYNQAMGSSQNLMSQLGFAQQGLNNLNALGQSGFQAGMQNQQYQLGLQNQANQQYQTLGQFKLSGTTKNAIQSGLAGPGSYYTQTGVSRGNVGQFKNMQSTYENQLSDNNLNGILQQGFSQPDMWSKYQSNGQVNPLDFVRQRRSV